jgi:hypothetical protein
MNIFYKFAAIVLSVLCVTACDSGFEGTYSDERGLAEYKFTSDGVVSMSAMGSETEMPFEVEENKIKIGSDSEAKVVLTLAEDGVIKGPGGINLYRVYYLDGTFRHEESGVEVEFESDGSFQASEGGESRGSGGQHVVRGSTIVLEEGNKKQRWTLVDEDTIEAGDPDFVLRRN